MSRIIKSLKQAVRYARGDTSAGRSTFIRVPKCPRCHKGGYSQDASFDGRPRFHCGSCGHAWTCGHDGGEYAKPQ